MNIGITITALGIINLFGVLMIELPVFVMAFGYLASVCLIGYGAWMVLDNLS